MPRGAVICGSDRQRGPPPVGNRSYTAGLSCRITYSTWAWFGDGSTYGLSFVGQPVQFFELYSNQPAPYSSGITGICVDTMFAILLIAVCCWSAVEAAANSVSADCVAGSFHRPWSPEAVLPLTRLKSNQPSYWLYA